MIVSIDKSNDNRRYSGETTLTGSSRTLDGSFHKVKEGTTMTRQRSSDVQVMCETDEETAPSPVPSESEIVKVGSGSHCSASIEEAAMATHAIMNGKSISEIYCEDHSSSDNGMNDSGSQPSELKKTPKNPRQFDSFCSKASTDSALSEVLSDKLQESCQRSNPSSVRILQSPDGQRVKRKVPAHFARLSFPGDYDGSSDSPKSSSLKSSPLSGSERSSSVKVLRSSNGKRLNKRKEVPGQIAGLGVDLSEPFSASSSLRSESVWLYNEFPDNMETQQMPDDTLNVEDKVVTFGSVRVRYYERVLDINPACSSGVAIGLGWNYKKSKRISVDEYELQKGGVRYHARQLFLPRNVREDIVREFGYTQKDIAKGTRANFKLRNERKQTIDNLGMMGIEEKVEAAKRKIKKVLYFRKARRKNNE